MDSVQTLHDFTLTLLQDPSALAAFGQDPQAALAAAGLGDISAADVNEVAPLVLDYVPVDHLASLGHLPQAGDLTTALGEGPQGAIEQLQALTASLGVSAGGAAASAGTPGLGELGGAGCGRAARSRRAAGRGRAACCRRPPRSWRAARRERRGRRFGAARRR